MLDAIDLNSLETLAYTDLKSVLCPKFNLVTKANITFLNLSGCFDIKLLILISWRKIKPSFLLEIFD